jgi:hypothetical protein
MDPSASEESFAVDIREHFFFFVHVVHFSPTISRGVSQQGDGSMLFHFFHQCIIMMVFPPIFSNEKIGLLLIFIDFLRMALRYNIQ